MSNKYDLPDTYIDPWTGEEKKVEKWDEDCSLPLNSPYWAGHEEDGLDLPEGYDNFNRNNNEAEKWLSQKRAQRMLWIYVAIGLLFLLINFWVFRGALF